jgi:hypothetical protein
MAVYFTLHNLPTLLQGFYLHASLCPFSKVCKTMYCNHIAGLKFLLVLTKARIDLLCDGWIKGAVLLQLTAIFMRHHTVPSHSISLFKEHHILSLGIAYLHRLTPGFHDTDTLSLQH